MVRQSHSSWGHHQQNHGCRSILPHQRHPWRGCITWKHLGQWVWIWKLYVSSKTFTIAASTELRGWNLGFAAKAAAEWEPHVALILPKDQSSVRLHKLWPKPWAISGARQVNFSGQCSNIYFHFSQQHWKARQQHRTPGPAIQTNSGTEIQVFFTQNLSWWYRAQILWSSEDTALSMWK